MQSKAIELALVLQGRKAVENWLLVAGTGLLGSLATLTWRLVQGMTIVEPVNKGLLVAVMVCMLVIVVLTALNRPKGRSAAPATA